MKNFNLIFLIPLFLIQANISFAGREGFENYSSKRNTYENHTHFQKPRTCSVHNIDKTTLCLNNIEQDTNSPKHNANPWKKSISDRV